MTLLTEKTDPAAFHPNPEKPLAYLKACPVYVPSPLTKIALNEGYSVFAKDETSRMGLGAFKALGGPYAVARLIEDRWRDRHHEDLAPSRILDEDVKQVAAEMTFVCASAGNHGLGVAAGARLFGASARIYLANSVPLEFEKRLARMGAEVVRAGDVYDESVAAALEDSNKTGATLLADGTWPGYTEIPMHVMEGYTVIAEELRHDFENSEIWPTHVYLQAGVGGLAAAIAYMIRKNWMVQPEIIVVEPDAAPCLQASSNAGHPIRADGPASNMGRLDCKEPSLVAWQTLESASVKYMTVTDGEAQAAAEDLKKHGIPTTPSGAAGLAALLKTTPADPKNFRPLIIVSEGT
ncbi:MAG: diaminopropionate ammonia-lyase [Sneathiella sp.]